MVKLSDFLPGGEEPEVRTEEELEPGVLQEEQQEEMEASRSLLNDDTQYVRRLTREAEREVQTAAQDSLRKLHVVKMGRCPECGDNLRRHLFAQICENCGWHRFEKPRRTPVRIHLTGGGTPVEGERVYEIKSGAVLVLRDDLVVAKVPREAVAWIEYLWSDEEIDQRHRQVVERMDINCGWCGDPADPDKDGFHLVHVAFGASQERYCFCSDECFEAFRKMYPARVDRDCYERNCAECNLCLKRYDDAAEGIRQLAKDFIQMQANKRQAEKRDKQN